MRCGRKRARAGALMVAAVMVGGVAQPAFAVPLMFPTDQTLIPLAVAGAFAFPALLAAFIGWFRRLLSEGRLAVGVGVLAVMALAVVGLLNPELLLALRT